MEYSKICKTCIADSEIIKKKVEISTLWVCSFKRFKISRSTIK